MKLDKDLIIKIAGIGLTLAGTIVSGIAAKNDNKEELKKLVEETFKTKK